MVEEDALGPAVIELVVAFILDGVSQIVEVVTERLKDLWARVEELTPVDAVAIL